MRNKIYSRLKLLGNKEYWIKIFMFGFPYFLIVDALKVILINILLITRGMSTYLAHSTSMFLLIGDMGLSIGLTFAALLVLCGSIGLILKKNWARGYMFIIFLHYCIFQILFILYASGNMSSSLIEMIPATIIYMLIIYVYTRPKVRERFK
ncbi:MAG: hypothetical protein ABIG64_04245 [Candidatus Omnitrophota bacterium]